MPDPWLLLLGCMGFLVAGTVKGVIGLGLPMVSLGFLGLIFTPSQAASLIVVPGLVANVWQFFGGPVPVLVARRMAPMMLAMVFGVWVGVGLVLGSSTTAAGVALGVLLIVYALLGLNNRWPVLSRWQQRWFSVPAGFLTGMLSGATGVMSMPGLAYLQGLGWERRQFIQALGLMFTTGSISLGLTLWWNAARWDSLPALTWLGLSVLGTLAALLGMKFGRWVEPRLSKRLFGRLFGSWLIINGIAIIVRKLA